MAFLKYLCNKKIEKTVDMWIKFVYRWCIVCLMKHSSCRWLGSFQKSYKHKRTVRLRLRDISPTNPDNNEVIRRLSCSSMHPVRSSDLDGCQALMVICVLFGVSTLTHYSSSANRNPTRGNVSDQITMKVFF